MVLLFSYLWIQIIASFIGLLCIVMLSYIAYPAVKLNDTLKTSLMKIGTLIKKLFYGVGWAIGLIFVLVVADVLGNTILLLFGGKPAFHSRYFFQGKK